MKRKDIKGKKKIEKKYKETEIPPNEQWIPYVIFIATSVLLVTIVIIAIAQVCFGFFNNEPYYSYRGIIALVGIGIFAVGFLLKYNLYITSDAYMLIATLWMCAGCFLLWKIQ